MAAILDRPHHLGAEALPHPHHRLGMPAAGRHNDLFAKLAPNFVDGDKRVRALVHIGSNNNHDGCLLHCEVTVGPVGGHISVGGGATLLSSHAGRSFTPDADKTHERQPEAARMLRARHQVIRIQPPQHAAPHPDTDPMLLTSGGPVGLRRGRQSCRFTLSAKSRRCSRSDRSSSCRYTRCTPISANGPSCSTISPGIPTSGELDRSSSTSRPMAAARRLISESSRPAHTTNAAEYVMESAGRPTASTASRTRSNCVLMVSNEANGTLNSSANVAASAGVRFAPVPPMMIGGWGRCTGFGRAGESLIA